MKENLVYKVKFFENDRNNPLEIMVKDIGPSDFPGLVCFRDFVFKDQTKKIILPEEDAATKRFSKTKSIHVPYHNILFIEEIEEEKVDLKQLPFLREIEQSSE